MAAQRPAQAVLQHVGVVLILKFPFARPFAISAVCMVQKWAEICEFHAEDAAQGKVMLFWLFDVVPRIDC